MSITDSMTTGGGASTRNASSRDSHGELPQPLPQLFAPIADDLQAVEAILQQELVSHHEGIHALLQQGVRLGGKRLRPALLLLTARTCGSVTPAHHTLAAVLEMIHTATLVHDDVLDDAMLRRHNATVNALAGNAASVLLGDYLFSHAFYLASTLDNTWACQRIGRTTNIVCEGEMRQIQSRGNYALSEAEYLEIVEAKTAELCACCGELGALYAGAPAAQQRACQAYGRYLGIAFQIVDDILDLVGDPDRTGKSLGTDLAQEKLTLPVIHLLGQSPPAGRRAVVERLGRCGRDDRGDFPDLLQHSGALAYARKVARRYVQQAQEQLDGLPAGPAREALRQLTAFVMARQH